LLAQEFVDLSVVAEVSCFGEKMFDLNLTSAGHNSSSSKNQEEITSSVLVPRRPDRRCTDRTRHPPLALRDFEAALRSCCKAVVRGSELCVGLWMEPTWGEIVADSLIKFHFSPTSEGHNGLASVLAGGCDLFGQTCLYLAHRGRGKLVLPNSGSPEMDASPFTDLGPEHRLRLFVESTNARSNAVGRWWAYEICEELGGVTVSQPTEVEWCDAADRDTVRGISWEFVVATSSENVATLEKLKAAALAAQSADCRVDVHIVGGPCREFRLGLSNAVALSH
jgi:hypothetical protein